MPTRDESKNRSMVGKHFGRWEVLKIHSGHTPFSWVCKCDCGTEKVVNESNLVTGKTLSCGCIQKNRPSWNHKYDEINTPTFNSWRAMKHRCESPNNNRYKYYGLKGIKVCDSWQDFRNFLRDMGERPEGYKIDRINNEGDYEPNNCRWADSITQMNNTSRNHMETYRGITKTVADWARYYGIKYSVLYGKIQRGYAIDVALAQCGIKNEVTADLNG